MKKESFLIWMTLVLALTFITFGANNAAAQDFPKFAAEHGYEHYSEVFSTTGELISEKGGISCRSQEAAKAGLDMLKMGGGGYPLHSPSPYSLWFAFRRSEVRVNYPVMGNRIDSHSLLRQAQEQFASTR